jgi:hypothetical protein
MGFSSWQPTSRRIVMALRAAGICRGGLSGSDYFNWEMTLAEFQVWVEGRRKKGLRLIDLETYLVAGKRRWAGVVRSGNWTQKVLYGLTPTTFFQALSDPANQGLAPCILEVYVDGGKVNFATILRSGLDPSKMSIVLDVNSTALKAANTKNEGQGKRLADIESYSSGGKRLWAAIWMAGDWDSYLLIDKDFPSFLKQTQDKFDVDGMRLMDVETYVENGKRLWGGYGRKATWANSFLAEMSLSAFKQKVQDLFDKSSRQLVRLEIYDA